MLMLIFKCFNKFKNLWKDWLKFCCMFNLIIWLILKCSKLLSRMSWILLSFKFCPVIKKYFINWRSSLLFKKLIKIKINWQDSLRLLIDLMKNRYSCLNICLISTINKLQHIWKSCSLANINNYHLLNFWSLQLKN